MIQKTTILPIISTLSLLVQAIFHKDIPAELQDQISTVLVNVIFVGFSIYGIFKNHNQKG